MKGGSIASDALHTEISNDVWDDMNTRFSNLFTGGSLKTSRKHNKICLHCGNLVNNHNTVKKGGNSPVTTASLFASAAKFLSGTPIQTLETFKGGNKIGGSSGIYNDYAAVPTEKMYMSDNISKDLVIPKEYANALISQNGGLRNINEYSKKGSFKLFNNKIRGGSDNDLQPVNIGLDTKTTITSHGNTVGTSPNRVPDVNVLNTIANENIVGPHMMNKIANYGNVSGEDVNNTNFAYGGAKTKKQPKKRASTKATKKDTSTKVASKNAKKVLKKDSKKENKSQQKTKSINPKTTIKRTKCT